MLISSVFTGVLFVVPSEAASYHDGCIYKIDSKQGNKFYIGSTTEPLPQRLARHKSYAKTHKKGTFHRVTSEDVTRYPDAEISVLEKVPCRSQAALELVEKKYVQAATDPSRKRNRDSHCVNKRYAQKSTP